MYLEEVVMQFLLVLLFNPRLSDSWKLLHFIWFTKEKSVENWNWVLASCLINEVIEVKLASSSDVWFHNLWSHCNWQPKPDKPNTFLTVNLAHFRNTEDGKIGLHETSRNTCNIRIEHTLVYVPNVVVHSHWTCCQWLLRWRFANADHLYTMKEHLSTCSEDISFFSAWDDYSNLGFSVQILFIVSSWQCRFSTHSIKKWLIAAGSFIIPMHNYRLCMCVFLKAGLTFFEKKLN